MMKNAIRSGQIWVVVAIATAQVPAAIAASPAECPYYDVRTYGAVADGATPATAAIQKAVDTCAADGGGKVLIPAGRYVSGAIFLKSRVEIELGSGAVLLGSTNFADYPPIDGRWEGIERKVYASLFTGRGLEHVSITGRGVLDGRGQVWWAANRKTGELRKKAGLQGREPENPPDAPLRWPRPRMINLYNCTNVLIRDVTILNAPSWNVHPVYCENVTVDNVTITAPADSPNTDAVDPDSCRDVRITNCRMDVGDDCVVIKSGYNADGRRVGVACEDILVSNCLFLHGHGGVVIGSEMSGSVRNVAVVNCVFDGTQRGLRVKTALGRGGIVEHFRASNLVMRNITDAAFTVSSTYGDSQSGPETGKPAPEAIPVLRHIHWSNVSISNTKKVADLAGLGASPLEDLTLLDVQAVDAKTGIRCENAKGLRFGNLDIRTASGPAIEVQKASQVNILRLSVPQPSGDAPVLLFKDVNGAEVSGCTVSAGSGVFLQLSGTGNTGVNSDYNYLPAGINELGQ
jgi:polygalacturonase